MLLSAYVMVPPVCVDGLTTAVTAALYPAVEVEPPDDDPPLLPQAAIVSATAALNAASPIVTGLFTAEPPPLVIDETCRYAGYRVLGSSASRSPSPNRLKAMTVRKIATPGMIMYIGSTE